VIRAAWHPLSKRELFEAQDFYEDRAAGLGDTFLERVIGGTMSQLTCPKCNNTMEPGFVVDHTYRGSAESAPPEWAEGAAQISMWTGGVKKMSGKERHPIQTFRCVRCGYLESYARLPTEMPE
jgi:predicted nucleic-acid-binding Zn-ribbon protein